MEKEKRQKKKTIWIGLGIGLIIIAGYHMLFSEDKKENKIEWRIAAILPTEETNPFWNTVWDGVRKCAREKEVRLSEYQYDSFSDDSVEDLLEMAILAQTQAVILRASDYTSDRMKKLLDNAKEEQICVVLTDSDAQEQMRDLFVGLDNIEAGKKAARILIETYHPERILEIRNEGNPTSVTMRENAFHEYIQATNEAEIVSVTTLTGAEHVRYQTAQEAIQKAEKGDAIVCFGANTTLTAAKTIERLNMQDTVFLMGFGESEEAVEYVKSGEIDLLFAQENYEMGYRAVEYTVQILKEGKKKGQDKQYINVTAVTRENIEENK